MQRVACVGTLDVNNVAAARARPGKRCDTDLGTILDGRQHAVAARCDHYGVTASQQIRQQPWAGTGVGVPRTLMFGRANR
jgi:hypothetical protein